MLDRATEALNSGRAARALQWLAELLWYRISVLGEDAEEAEEKGGVSAFPKPTSNTLLGLVGLGEMLRRVGRVPANLGG